MGCSAAKNITVEQLKGAEETDSKGNETRKVSITRRASEVPTLQSDEPQTEMLDGSTVNNIQQSSNGLSFDIAFEEDSGESIILKHPPKRFQKLEEQQISPNLSLQRLQEKLDEAEVRRQMILQQRVASAKIRNGLRRGSNDEDADNNIPNGMDGEEEATKIPPDIQLTLNSK